MKPDDENASPGTDRGKYISSVKVGPKGQVVIPKEARAMDGGVLKIWRARPYPVSETAQSGIVLFADAKQGLVVATGDGAIELLEIQAPNAKRMDARAYLLGHTIEAGKPLSEVKAW